MQQGFSLRGYDAEFKERVSVEEWQRILVLRHHPDMMRGLFRYGELMPTYFSDNVLLNKVVTEAWRFEMLVYTLYLHDTRNPDDPATGLTVANLTRICAAQKVASRGRVLAILGIMQIAGYLHRRRSKIDARIVHLEPSAAFMEIVEGWNQRILQIIDAIDDTGELANAHVAVPRLGADMRTLGAERLLQGWKLLDPFPEVNHFVTRDGGWMLLLSCVAAALQPSSGEEIAPVALELGSFGKRFGVSRSHLRRVLEGAYDAGLLDLPPRNGQEIVLSPRLVASFLTCMASELGFYREHTLASLKTARPESWFAGEAPVVNSGDLYDTHVHHFSDTRRLREGMGG